MQVILDRGTPENETHIYRDLDADGRIIPGITTILTAAQMLDPQWFTDEGKARGSAVHAACHYLDENDLIWRTVDPAIVGYVRAWEKFKRESGFTPQLIEKTVWSDIHTAACTLDRCGPMQGHNAMVEIKTGEVEPWAGVQTAFQGVCVVELGLMPFIDLRGAAQLRADGTYRWKEFDEEADEAAALGAVATYHWKKNKGIIK